MIDLDHADLLADARYADRAIWKALDLLRRSIGDELHGHALDWIEDAWSALDIHWSIPQRINARKG